MDVHMPRRIFYHSVFKEADFIRAIQSESGYVRKGSLVDGRNWFSHVAKIPQKYDASTRIGMLNRELSAWDYSTTSIVGQTIRVE
jgi:hypothetical protein